MGQAMEQVMFSEEYYKALRDGDIPEKQALAMSHALRIALHQGVATHDDMRALDHRMEILEEDVKGLKEDVKGLKGDLKSLRGDVDGLKGAFGSMKLLMYVTIALVALTNPVAMHVFRLIGSLR